MICLKQFAYFNHTLFGLHPPPNHRHEILKYSPRTWPKMQFLSITFLAWKMALQNSQSPQIFKDRTNPAYILPPLTQAKKREITFSFLADAAGSSSFFRFFGGKGCVPSPSATAERQTLQLNLAIQKVLILIGSKAVMRVQCACHRRLLRRTWALHLWGGLEPCLPVRPLLQRKRFCSLHKGCPALQVVLATKRHPHHCSLRWPELKPEVAM